jgi:AMP deaminase
VTLDPSKDPKLHRFLRYLVGVDCVDDESKLEHRLMRKYPPPLEWNLPHNPPYSYYLYYLYSNLDVLNRLRRARGFCKTNSWHTPQFIATLFNFLI